MIFNFFKFLRASRPGTILYWHGMLLISCGCQPLYKRLVYGLTLKSKVASHDIELVKVRNLRGMTIIGKL